MPNRGLYFFLGGGTKSLEVAYRDRFAAISCLYGSGDGFLYPGPFLIQHRQNAPLQGIGSFLGSYFLQTVTAAAEWPGPFVSAAGPC